MRADCDMADYLLQKRYLNHFGLTLKSTDIVRPEQVALLT